jgi:hypothetical protein
MNEPPRLEAVVYLLPGCRMDRYRNDLSFGSLMGNNHQAIIMLARHNVPLGRGVEISFRGVSQDIIHFPQLKTPQPGPVPDVFSPSNG